MEKEPKYIPSLEEIKKAEEIATNEETQRGLSDLQRKTGLVIIGSLALGFLQNFLIGPIALNSSGNEVIVFCLISPIIPLVGSIIIYGTDNVSSGVRKIVNSILFFVLGVMMSFYGMYLAVTGGIGIL